MVIKELLPEYQCWGKAKNGIKLYHHNNSVYFVIPKELELNYGVLFFVHIYTEEMKGSSYIKRDFRWDSLSETEKTDRVVKIQNVGENLRHIEFGQWDGKERKCLWKEDICRRKLVLFQTDHYGSLIQLLCLRYKKHKEDAAVLLCPAGNSADKKRFLQALEEQGMFDMVITSFGIEQEILKAQDRESVQKKLLSEYERRLCSVGIDITKADAVYTQTDVHGLFQLFLALKGVPYIYVELMINQFEEKWRCTKLLKGGEISQAYQNLLNDHGIMKGTGTYCEKWILMNETFEKRKAFAKPTEFIHFSYEIQNIPKHTLQTVLSLCEINMNEIFDADVLLLPNSQFAFSEIWGKEYDYIFEKHIELYLYLLDYCGGLPENGKILVKPHPNSDFKLEQYLPNCKKIQNSFLIELICAYPDMKLKKVLSVKTTSIDKIRGQIVENVEVGRSFVKYFEELNCLSVIFHLFQMNCEQGITQYGYERGFFEGCKRLFCDMEENNEKIQIESLTIVSREAGREMEIEENRGIVAVVHAKSGIETFDYRIAGERLELYIKKNATRENVAVGLKEECILFFCRDSIIRERLRKVSYKRRLPCCGIELEAYWKDN